MKCRIKRTTDRAGDKPCKDAYLDDKYWYIDVESVQDLIDIVDEADEAIVFSIVPDHSAPPDIEIYDEYREPFSCICTVCKEEISSKEDVVGSSNFELQHAWCEKVKITAADYNPMIANPWDGCPFNAVPKWLTEALDNGVVTPHTRNCTDYAEWDVKTKEGLVSMSPGDYIVRANLASSA